MNNALYPPFSKATCEVFKLMLDLDASAGLPHVGEGVGEATDDVRVSVEVTGDLTGEIYYRFPRETTLKIVNIMSGMEFDQVDEFVTSALGEIANIISGNAMTTLSEQNVTCDIQPPRILNANEPLFGQGDVTVIEVKTYIGEVELGMRIKPKS